MKNKTMMQYLSGVIRMTTEYGDRFLTLFICACHVKEGRSVVAEGDFES